MMAEDKESCVLSVNEVAKILHLSRGSTYQGVLAGEIPHIRIGRRILIPRRALEKMLEGGNGKQHD